MVTNSHEGVVLLEFVSLRREKMKSFCCLLLSPEFKVFDTLKAKLTLFNLFYL